MSAPFAYDHTGRNRATLIAVLGVWAALAIVSLALEASLWLVVIIALFTLPALYDLISGRCAGLRMDDAGLHWFARQREGDVSWPEIDHIRLDTRLDMSVRASAVLHTGRKLRLPPEATPPHKDFEAALLARGVKVQRHHFTLVG